MPPPPSQKGKFKPRRPIKKAKPIATPVQTPSSAAAAASGGGAAATAATNTSSGSASAAGRSGGREGRGRGGRGGGRGSGRGPRAPVPQGQTFFTGGKKEQSTSVEETPKREAAIADKVKAKQEADGSEEVVGELDKAIGATSSPAKISSRSKSKKSDMKQIDLDAMDLFEDGTEAKKTRSSRASKTETLMQHILYDSDSSDEDGGQHSIPPSSNIQPLELPFPAGGLPLGVGAKDRPKMYEIRDEMKSSSGDVPQVLHQHEGEPEDDVSPFIGTDRSVYDRMQEEDSWFLVQLPTRLPPLRQIEPEVQIVPSSTVDGSGDSMADENAAETSDPSIADVVTPPVVPNSFDNSLANAEPGRLGKILVYKSGKTVLVMDGPNGSKVCEASIQAPPRNLFAFRSVLTS